MIKVVGICEYAIQKGTINNEMRNIVVSGIVVVANGAGGVMVDAFDFEPQTSLQLAPRGGDIT